MTLCSKPKKTFYGFYCKSPTVCLIFHTVQAQEKAFLSYNIIGTLVGNQRPQQTRLAVAMSLVFPPHHMFVAPEASLAALGNDVNLTEAEYLTDSHGRTALQQRLPMGGRLVHCIQYWEGWTHYGKEQAEIRLFPRSLT